MVYWYLIAEAAARSNVSTLFCGNLADLLLGGMPRFMVVQAAAQRRWIARPLEEFYNSTQNGHEPKSLLGRLLARLYYRKQPMQPPKVLHAESRREYTRFSFHSGDPLNELLIAGLQGQPNPNATCERLYASAGLSYTSPFYDLDVIDCAFRIPGDLKIRGRWQKYILRQAAKELMPQKLAKRPKGLLRLSRNIKLSEVMHSLAEHYLADDKVRARGLFDVEQVRQVRRRPQNATYPEDQLYRLWTLLLTEIWAVTFLDHAGAPADARPQLAALEVA